VIDLIEIIRTFECSEPFPEEDLKKMNHMDLFILVLAILKERQHENHR
jgi:hypothetical protein